MTNPDKPEGIRMQTCHKCGENIYRVKDTETGASVYLQPESIVYELGRFGRDGSRYAEKVDVELYLTVHQPFCKEQKELFEEETTDTFAEF